LYTVERLSKKSTLLLYPLSRMYLRVKELLGKPKYVSIFCCVFVVFSGLI